MSSDDVCENVGELAGDGADWVSRRQSSTINVVSGLGGGRLGVDRYGGVALGGLGDCSIGR